LGTKSLVINLIGGTMTFKTSFLIALITGSYMGFISSTFHLTSTQFWVLILPVNVGLILYGIFIEHETINE
jgi:hypothetical protein